MLSMLLLSILLILSILFDSIVVGDAAIKWYCYCRRRYQWIVSSAAMLLSIDSVVVKVRNVRP
jgi:hypothetical protein